LNLPLFISNRVGSAKNKAFAAMIVRLSILSCSLSIAVMVVAVALITGFKKEITDKMFDFWGHLVVTDTEINQSYTPVPVDTSKFQLDVIAGLTAGDLDPYYQRGYPTITTRSNDPLVRNVQSFILSPGILQVGADYEGIQVKGIGTDFHPSFYDKYLVTGAGINHFDDSISRDIVLSRQTADRLQVEVGASIVVYFVLDGDQITRRLQVSGIYKTGLEEYDKKVAFVDIGLLRQLLKWSPLESSGVEFFLYDINHLDAFTELILDEFIPLEYFAIDIRSRFPSLFEWLELQDYNKYLIVGLMLLVCIFNLITTSLILILERTSMIGVMKTLGMPDKKLRMVFVYLSFRILLVSLLVGNGIGLTICWLQKKYSLIKLNEADYYLAEAPIHFAWISFAFINLVLMVVIFLFLLIPASMVQRISPVKAIRLN